MKMTSTISSKGQITLPKHARDALGIHPGQELEYEIKDGTVIVRKRLTIQDYYGKLDGFWGPRDPAEEIREWRDRESPF